LYPGILVRVKKKKTQKKKKKKPFECEGYIWTDFK